MAENSKADLVIKFIIIALIAIFLGAAAWSMFESKQQVTPTAQQSSTQSGAQGQAAGQRQANAAAITVSAQTMERGVIRQIVRLNGDVTSQTEIGIFPDTAGKILRLVKSVGDSVARGETIGYIDPSRAGVAYEQNPITATVAGTITALPVSQGETVSTSTRIATIGSLGSLKITVYVAEKYSAFLRRGRPAVVSFAAAPGEQFNASAVTVSPVVNSANRTIETSLTLSHADARIKPGMYANVDLVIREQTGTFVLPKNAVKNYNDTQVIYKIDENNIARRTTITTGLSNDSEIEILSGISAGDKVITAGAVTDGSPVREAAAFGASSDQ
jgi:multidrug efflux pump subunit AcrA (membrane-fusion protein)